jgi:YD repeat-containing protein
VGASLKVLGALFAALVLIGCSGREPTDPAPTVGSVEQAAVYGGAVPYIGDPDRSKPNRGCGEGDVASDDGFIYSRTPLCADLVSAGDVCLPPPATKGGDGSQGGWQNPPSKWWWSYAPLTKDDIDKDCKALCASKAGVEENELVACFFDTKDEECTEVTDGGMWWVDCLKLAPIPSSDVCCPINEIETRCGPPGTVQCGGENDAGLPDAGPPPEPVFPPVPPPGGGNSGGTGVSIAEYCSKFQGPAYPDICLCRSDFPPGNLPFCSDGGRPNLDGGGGSPQPDGGWNPPATTGCKFAQTQCTKNPQAGDRAPSDFVCEKVPNSNDSWLCKMNLAVHTSIAGETNNYTCNQFAPQRYFHMDPNALPLPREATKRPSQILVDAPGCGGVEDGESTVADGVNLRDGALAKTFGCFAHGGGRLPIEVGIRYETGASRETSPEYCRDPDTNELTNTPVPGGRPSYSAYRSADLSPGWTVSYSRRAMNTTPNITSPAEYTVYFENQRAYRFIQDPVTRVFRQPRMTNDDAAVLRVEGAYVILTFRDGTRNYFNVSDGTLVREVDRWGNIIDIQYFYFPNASPPTMTKRLIKPGPGFPDDKSKSQYVDLNHEWITYTSPENPAKPVKHWRLRNVVDSTGRGFNIDFEQDTARVSVFRAPTKPEAGSPEATSRFTYDARGRVTTIVDPLNSPMVIAYRERPAIGAAPREGKGTFGFSSVATELRVPNGTTAADPAVTTFAWAVGTGPSDYRVTLPNGTRLFFAHEFSEFGAPAASAANAFVAAERNRVITAFAPLNANVAPTPATARSTFSYKPFTGLPDAFCANAAIGGSDTTCTIFGYTSTTGAGPFTLPHYQCGASADQTNISGCSLRRKYDPICKLPTEIIDGDVGILPNATPGFGTSVVTYDNDDSNGRYPTCRVMTVALPPASEGAEESLTFNYYSEGTANGLVRSIKSSTGLVNETVRRYDANGFLDAVDYGNNVVESFRRNDRGDVVEATDSRGIRLRRRISRFDGRPDQEARGDGAQALVTTFFDYDVLGQPGALEVSWGSGKRRIRPTYDVVDVDGRRGLVSLVDGETSSTPVSTSWTIDWSRPGARVATLQNGRESAFHREPLATGGARLRELRPGLGEDVVAQQPNGAGGPAESKAFGAPSGTLTTYNRLRQTGSATGASAQLQTAIAYYRNTKIPYMTWGEAGCTRATYGARGKPILVERLARGTGVPPMDGSWDGRGAYCASTPVATTSIDYDATGRIAREEVTEANRSTITVYEYDGLSRPIRVCVDPDGQNLCTRTTYATEGANRLDPWQVTRPNGETTEFRYDALGNVKSVRNAKGDEFLFTYRPDGVLLQQSGAGRTTIYGYDDFGRQVSETNSDGNTATIRRWVLDADGDTTEFYDFESVVTGRYVKYIRNPQTKRVRVVEPNGGLGCRSVFAPDVIYTTLTESCPDGFDADSPEAPRVELTYFRHGGVRTTTETVRELCTSDEACGNNNACLIAKDATVGVCRLPRRTSSEYEYDDLLQLKSRTRFSPEFPGGHSVSYERTYANGQLSEEAMTYSTFGTVTRRMDGFGRLASLIPWTGRRVDYGYNERVGALDFVRVAGGVMNQAFNYDAAGFLSQVIARTGSSVRRGANILDLEYPERNKNGALKRSQETWFASDDPQFEGIASNFEYDPLEQLTEARMGALSDSWSGATRASARVFAYDAAGNRVFDGKVGYSVDRRDQITTDGFRYDLNGSISAVPDPNLLENPDFLESPNLKDWVAWGSGSAEATGSMFAGKREVRVASGDGSQFLFQRAPVSAAQGDRYVISILARGESGGEQLMSSVQRDETPFDILGAAFATTTRRYQRYGGVFTFPAGANPFRVSFGVNSANQRIFMTGARLTRLAPATSQQLYNVSFEDDFVAWSQWSSAPGAQFEIVGGALEGARAAAITAAQGQQAAVAQRLPLPVRGGQRYRLSIAVLGGTVNFKLQRGAAPFDIPGAAFCTATGTTWNECSTVVQIPASGWDGARVDYNISVGDFAVIDKARLELVQ